MYDYYSGGKPSASYTTSDGVTLFTKNVNVPLKTSGSLDLSDATYNLTNFSQNIVRWGDRIAKNVKFIGDSLNNCKYILSDTPENNQIKINDKWVNVIFDDPHDIRGGYKVKFGATEESSMVPIDELKASAEKGDAKSQYLLGLQYSKGGDIPQDKVKAYIWLNRAAEQGYSQAIWARYELSTIMSQNEIAKAKRSAKDELFNQKQNNTKNLAPHVLEFVSSLNPGESKKTSVNTTTANSQNPFESYSLSNNPQDNLFGRSSNNGYIIVMQGTYSNPHDMLSQFNPEKTLLIYSDEKGEKSILGIGKLTVEEFRKFDFSNESIRKYFGEDIKEAN